MKTTFLLIGILIGGILGFAIAKFGLTPKAEKTEIISKKPVTEDWKWPENLDALKAAPENHTVVFEDDNMRVLAVLLDGKKSEPIHTHKYKSVMWISKPIVPCQINNYKKDEKGNLVKTDSMTINEMPVNIGQMVDPEGPTSITNLGSENGLAYRVEFKKEFVK